MKNKNNKDIKLSKYLSWLLRHGAVKDGLDINSAGYVKIDDILDQKNNKHMTFDDIKNVVKNNDKKRFELNIFDNSWYIRFDNPIYSSPIHKLNRA